MKQVNKLYNNVFKLVIAIIFFVTQVAAPEIAMIKVAVPNMAQKVIDSAIQVCTSFITISRNVCQ